MDSIKETVEERFDIEKLKKMHKNKFKLSENVS